MILDAWEILPPPHFSINTSVEDEKILVSRHLNACNSFLNLLMPCVQFEDK